MGCDCGKPKCDGHCGVSPAVLQINNPSECVLFHRVEVPASMGDSKTNPPKNGAYKNVLLYYEADQTSWLYSSDGIPQKLVNGLTNYEDAINLPQINGVTLLGDKNSADLKLADAPMVITIASGNAAWSGADTAEDIYNFFLNQGKVNVVFEGSENYGYEIVSAAYIPGEQKMMCMTTIASVDTGSSPVEFTGSALYGLMTFYTVDKAVDVGELDLQPKLFITDFTGLSMIDGNVLEGVPATNASIGMVKPGDGLSVSSDGTLTVIDHVFDTVADMKLATNLTNGSYAQTLGFHTINDGGGALYKITNSGTANEMDVIAVGDLYANLVYGNEINVRQLGAYGDDTHDDANAVKRAISLVKHIIIPDGTYLLNSEVTIQGSFDTSSYRIECNGTLHTTATNGLVILGSYHDVYIQKFTGNNSNTLIALTTDETYTTCGYNQLNLRIGTDCNNAIALIPTRQGVLYNNINFSNLFANNACILFQTDDVNASYVNENHFVGGRCNTGTGIKMVKGAAQTDKYNGNRFETIGFEGIDCGIDIEYASRNNFVDCRTSESLTGSYWVKVSNDCFNNHFKFEVIPVNKIQDLNNNQGSFNTYEGSLLIDGNSNASSMRIMMGGIKVFPNKYNFYKYQSYVDMYNQTSGAMTADYYYNDMVFRVGADDASNISLHMSDAFARSGITSFYVFIRKLPSGSTFEIKNRANSSVVIRQSNFTAPIENKMYHIEYTPGLSFTGNDWAVTSVFRI